MADLNDLRLPIGWRAGPTATDEEPQEGRLLGPQLEEWPGLNLLDSKTRRLWVAAVPAHLAGWLITIFAISLGAPFWFDMLNKAVSIRSVGKAPEEKQKSPKEVPKPKEPGTDDE